MEIKSKEKQGENNVCTKASRNFFSSDVKGTKEYICHDCGREYNETRVGWVKCLTKICDEWICQTCERGLPAGDLFYCSLCEDLDMLTS